LRYQSPVDPAYSFNDKLDYNDQDFVFVIQKKIVTDSFIEEEDTALVQCKQVKKLMRASLFFTD